MSTPLPTGVATQASVTRARRWEAATSQGENRTGPVPESRKPTELINRDQENSVVIWRRFWVPFFVSTPPFFFL